jgi:hypothetical protein
MVRRFALAGFAAAALVACAAFAPAATAGNVAWSVTLGAPGVAVSAGAPGYGAWGGPYYGPAAPIRYAASIAIVPPVAYPHGPYVAVARPYLYPRYRPYVYGHAWHGPVAPVHYAYGYYGGH